METQFVLSIDLRSP